MRKTTVLIDPKIAVNHDGCVYVKASQKLTSTETDDGTLDFDCHAPSPWRRMPALDGYDNILATLTNPTTAPTNLTVVEDANRELVSLVTQRGRMKRRWDRPTDPIAYE